MMQQAELRKRSSLLYLYLDTPYRAFYIREI